jgi:5-methylcytosine-specific restriction protein A
LIAELKLRAEQAPKKPVQRVAGTTVFVRNPAVAEYAKRLADGTCDLCLAPAPFAHKQIPYLECHHVIWLSAGGDDTIDNTVALCPNCHRKMHVVDAQQDRQTLLARLAKRNQAA